MKKILGLAVAVAVAFAFSAYAEEKAKVEIKKTGDEVKTVIKEKVPGEKVKETIVQKPGETDITKVTKTPSSPLVKETVTFDRMEQNGDYIYVMKDDKVVRLKHTLTADMKKNMLTKKKGEKITVTSTYPLTNKDLAVIVEAK